MQALISKEELERAFDARFPTGNEGEITPTPVWQ